MIAMLHHNHSTRVKPPRCSSKAMNPSSRRSPGLYTWDRTGPPPPTPNLPTNIIPTNIA